MEIVIASRNGYKIRETKKVLKKFSCFDIFSLIDFPHYIASESSNETVERMTLSKALPAARALQRPVIADTSILVVPSLKNDPGLASERYAGPNATEKDNRKKLLEAMSHLEGPVNRSCYFECYMVLASPEGTFKAVKEFCEGYISEEEKGGGGFGYDPLFVKHDYKLTFAELSEDIKNKISHRAKALERLCVELDSLSLTGKM